MLISVAKPPPPACYYFAFSVKRNLQEKSYLLLNTLPYAVSAVSDSLRLQRLGCRVKEGPLSKV